MGFWFKKSSIGLKNQSSRGRQSPTTRSVNRNSNKNKCTPRKTKFHPRRAFKRGLKAVRLENGAPSLPIFCRPFIFLRCSVPRSIYVQHICIYLSPGKS